MLKKSGASSERSAVGLVLATAFSVVLVAEPAAAQLRYVEGFVEGRNAQYNPINPPLTTTVTTIGGRQCNDPNLNPLKFCKGGSFPGLAKNKKILPVGTGTGPLWARLSAGTMTGDPVQMPFATEWGLTTMGNLPKGVIPGIVSIMTWFKGRNAAALSATGKGWSSGGGPGNTIFAPAVAGIPAAPFTTRTFPSATPGTFGNTVVPGNPLTVTFPALPAQPASVVRMQVTAGPRQFGGSVQILADTPNQLTLSTPGGNNFVRTNGRCGTSPTLCKPERGTTLTWTTAQIYKATAIPVTLTVFLRWYAMPWTTGTVSVGANLGPQQTSFGRTGTDVGGSARHLVMVTPALAYGQPLPPNPTADAGQIWDWNITFVPEPAAPLGLACSLGLLGVLFMLRGRVRRS